jgi:hypothetical protein
VPHGPREHTRAGSRGCRAPLPRHTLHVSPKEGFGASPPPHAIPDVRVWALIAFGSEIHSVA